MAREGDEGLVEKSEIKKPTLEELLEQKKELFEDHPEQFIHRTDIVAGIIRTSKGLGFNICAKNRPELIMAFGEIQIAIINYINNIDKETKDNKIIIGNDLNKRGMKGFLNKKRF